MPQGEAARESLPISVIDAPGQWNASNPALAIPETWSATGFMDVAGVTLVCARALDADGDPVADAWITFEASQGRLAPPGNSTDSSGIACSHFASGLSPGHAVIKFQARWHGLQSAPATHQVEVVGTQYGAPVSANSWRLAAAGGVMLVFAVVVLGSVRPRRARSRIELALLVVGLALAGAATTTNLLGHQELLSGVTGDGHGGSHDAPSTALDASQREVVEGVHNPVVLVVLVEGATAAGAGLFWLGAATARGPPAALRWGAGFLLLLDALLHGLAAGDHSHTLAHGLLHGMVAVGQAGLAIALIVRPRRLQEAAAIGLCAGLIAAYAAAVTWGLPGLGGPETVTPLGVASKTLEVLIVVLASMLLIRGSRQDDPRDHPARGDGALDLHGRQAGPAWGDPSAEQSVAPPANLHP